MRYAKWPLSKMAARHLIPFIGGNSSKSMARCQLPAPVAQLDRATASGAVGCGFEPRRAHSDFVGPEHRPLTRPATGQLPYNSAGGLFATAGFRHPSASMRPSKSFLLAMPVIWSRSCPFLKKSNDGMARMLYLNERLWFSSTLTLAILIAPAFSRAISSSSGAIILQGPHHSAQKSTITGLLLWVTSRSKLDSSTLIVVELSMVFRKSKSKSG